MVRKTYSGIRGPHRCYVVVTEDGRRTQNLNPRLDLCRHSPTGFEWGYCGSGPAQLALALLADFFGGYAGDGEKLALDLHQDFQSCVIARLPHSRWTLSDVEIDAAVNAICRDREQKALDGSLAWLGEMIGEL